MVAAGEVAYDPGALDSVAQAEDVEHSAAGAVHWGHHLYYYSWAGVVVGVVAGADAGSVVVAFPFEVAAAAAVVVADAFVAVAVN